jgi:hypothetical protein
VHQMMRVRLSKRKMKPTLTTIMGAISNPLQQAPSNKAERKKIPKNKAILEVTEWWWILLLPLFNNKKREEEKSIRIKIKTTTRRIKINFIKITDKSSGARIVTPMII